MRLIPLANVDDAVVDETFSILTDSPPTIVDVAVVVGMKRDTGLGGGFVWAKGGTPVVPIKPGLP